ncbi:glycosyltransferase [Vibrio nigripulchritudo]|uniref:glycosyltransferase n=1 Tax=Vibrio nigripulchritudo TaxID=28173 RepID=UPI0003B221D6|nr:glycosyltransferase [Vibrio nigripulchritudo]CCN70287.1 Glycosyl transferase, group 2 family protein [Vibrio nigripulchritudo SFn118]
MKKTIKKILKAILMRLPLNIREIVVSLYMKIFLSENKVRQSSIQGDLSLLTNFDTRIKEFLVFPVIDWNFRIQRPQHLTKEMAKLDCIVIYFTTQFNFNRLPGFKVLESPEKNVLIVSLNLNYRGVNIYRDTLTKKQLSFLYQSINSLRQALDLGHVTSIVDHPFWGELACSLPSNNVVYDCMDHHAGFENNDSGIEKREVDLFRASDLVVTTAHRLSKHVVQYVPNHIVRNAAEVEYFSRIPKESLLKNEKPVIGYYGAIAEWFDLDLLIEAAKALPEYDFVIIGGITIDVSLAEECTNVSFLGEKPYSDLTKYLAGFDVCIIPFRLVELTLCTNPVKIYEYLAAGKPTVCTAMPEVVAMNEVVHVANNNAEFVNLIQKAMLEITNFALKEKRKQWARQHSWKNRAQDLISLTNTISPPSVSIIVLTYNNLNLTKDCLKSIEENTKYENYEVIIVDNLSTDGTRDYLTENYIGKEKYTIILNDENLGFAAGNNIGLKTAKGDILVILNNDTYVAPFWLGALVNALKNNPELGLVGPVTNNIGNEAKININYENWSDLKVKAMSYNSLHACQIYPIDCAAFFCVAMPRKVYEKLGPMSLDYGLGFFEDDDYCMRVKEAGWRIAAVEDSFVHHHLSASFNKLGEERKHQLMMKNKKIFESRWGTWSPHRYRKGVY